MRNLLVTDAGANWTTALLPFFLLFLLCLVISYSVIRQRRTRVEITRAQVEAIKRAENLVTAGRYEEAAVIYEGLGMLEKAGECKKLAKTT